MRVSMCTIAWKPTPIEAVLPTIAAAGYDGAELWGPHLDRFAAEHGSLDPLVQQLAALGLQAPMVSAYFDLRNEPDEGIAVATRHIHYALRVGAPLVRMFTGGGSSAAEPEVWAVVAEVLGEICTLAAPYGVGLALETHQGHLHDSTPGTLRLLQMVNARNLGVNLDIYNLFAIGEDPLEALAQLEPWLRIVHLKNGRTVGAASQPCGLAEGDLDYGPFLRALAERAYGGFVSVEWFGPEPDRAAIAELAAVRQALAASRVGSP